VTGTNDKDVKHPRALPAQAAKIKRGRLRG
jgi:hypothetical protein